MSRRRKPLRSAAFDRRARSMPSPRQAEGSGSDLHRPVCQEPIELRRADLDLTRSGLPVEDPAPEATQRRDGLPIDVMAPEVIPEIRVHVPAVGSEDGVDHVNVVCPLKIEQENPSARWHPLPDLPGDSSGRRVVPKIKGPGPWTLQE